MSRKLLLIVLVAIFMAPMAMCWGQDEAGRPPRERGDRRRMGIGGPMRPGPVSLLTAFDNVVRQLPERLGITSAQLDRFNAMVKQRRMALEEIQKRLEMEKKALDNDLNAILNPDQQKKLAELKKSRELMMARGGPAMGRGQRMETAIDEMNLPAEKKEELKKIVQEHQTAMTSATDRETRRTAAREMMDKIKNALTPEEFAEFTSKVGGPMGMRGPGGRGPGMGPGPMGGPPQPPAGEQESLW